MAITNYERVGKALDLLRADADAGRIAQEVEATAPGGIPDPVVRTVTETAAR